MAGRAVVPGHVTGFFSVHRADDPATTGSTGAGIAIADGVTVTVEQADTRTVELNGTAATVDPVETVLDAFGTPVRVEIETALPVGAGFGVSGAATLGTAMATATVLDEPRSEQTLIELAHTAEVKAHTGLGDVVAQARGGVPIRLAPGAAGALDGIPATGRIEYLALGDLSTAQVLTDDTTRLSAAGTAALDRLRETPTLDTLFDAAREFAIEADLLTPAVREAITAVEAAGGTAMMSMLGETVIARGTGLSDAGYEPTVTGIDHAGARLTGESGDF